MTSCSQLCTTSLDCDSDEVCADIGCVPREPTLDRDGWDDPPGQGMVFFGSRFSILSSPSPEECWRYPGYCTALGRANVAAGSADRLRGFMAGPARLLLEIAGRDLPPSTAEELVTVKLYDLSEFGTCLAVSDGQIRQTQAVTRLRATLVGEHLVSTSTSAWVVDLGVRLWLERLQVRIELPERGDFARVHLLATLPAAWLGTLTNPHCDGVNPLCPTCEDGRNTLCPTYPMESTVLEAIAGFEDIDTDLDEPRDGLERIRLGPDKLLRDCVLEDRSIAEGRGCSSVLSDGFSSVHSFSALLTDRRFCPAPE